MPGAKTTEVVLAANATTDVELDDGTTISVELDGAGNASAVLVTLFEGAAAVVIVEGAPGDDADADLVSSVVNIEPVDSNASGRVNVSFILVDEAAQTLGGEACSVLSLGVLLFSGGDDGCVAGCCKDVEAEEGSDGDDSRACECNSEMVRGARCERELRCSAARGVSAGGARDSEACLTATGSAAVGDGATATNASVAGGEEEVIICSCEEMNDIAVSAALPATSRPTLPHRPGRTAHRRSSPTASPPTSSGRHASPLGQPSRTWPLADAPTAARQIGSDPDYARKLATVSGAGLVGFCVAALLFVLVALCAWWRDLRLVYLHAAPSHFLPETLPGLFKLHVRVYATLCRPWHVVPGFVHYTRLQLLSHATTNVLILACCALLFAGVDQCNPAKTLTASLVSAILSSLVNLVGRLLFKRADCATRDANRPRPQTPRTRRCADQAAC